MEKIPFHQKGKMDDVIDSKSFEKNIFVNCPFDDSYQLKLLRPLIFTIVYFGFNPRIALESSDSGQPRLEKLLGLIKESRYSIHDLSRLQSSKPGEFYRLNMPFELGLDYGAKHYHADLSGKMFLILEKEKHDYKKAFSDISGLDIKSHKDIPEKIVRRTREWFIETVGLKDIPYPGKIWIDFNDFNTKLFEDKLSHYREEYGHSKPEAEEIVKDAISTMLLFEYKQETEKYISARVRK